MNRTNRVRNMRILRQTLVTSKAIYKYGNGLVKQTELSRNRIAVRNTTSDTHNNNQWKNTNNAVQVLVPERTCSKATSNESPFVQTGYSDQSAVNSQSLAEHSTTGLGYSNYSSDSSDDVDLGSTVVDQAQQPANVDKSPENHSEHVSHEQNEIAQDPVPENMENTEFDGDVVAHNDTIQLAPLEPLKDSFNKKPTRSMPLGQRVKHAWLFAKRSLKNDDTFGNKKLSSEHLSSSPPIQSNATENKGDQLRTPVGHLQPWPIAGRSQLKTQRSRSSEDVPLVSSEMLLRSHTESLMHSLKEATLQLARRDMEMQRLLAVNGQLGERYCRIRNQYTELAREQARLRQRYDLLLVKGMDREQLQLQNKHLEAQLSDLQAQLAKAEERANQSTRRLGRVEAEAKDIVQTVNSADLQLANLRAELHRKEAQIAALSCRQSLDATREMEARAILNELIELKGNIRVIIRCHEKPNEESMFRFVGDDTIGLKHSIGGVASNRSVPHLFKAYRVFPPGSTQRAVFDELSELITSCVDGYGASIITYGQTGTGKTYTMLGAPNKPGIIPRAARHLLVQCHHRAPLWTYRLSIAVVQVSPPETVLIGFFRTLIHAL
ncbi:unnamed protein product [Echinostoma caproni]|uniref:Kinesin motor domain-containing protein n=1 Tax=Echinostoma caproni TaxID=27848 RepID=A0A183ATI6_9TREM|nr:unnamed protein product [Echinostoma caproni]